MNQPPVFASALRVVLLDALAASDMAEDVILLAVPLRRYQLENWLPDDFMRRITEYPFGAEIPRRDEAVQILADDCIVGRFNNGRQPCRGIQSGFVIDHASDRSYETKRSPNMGFAAPKNNNHARFGHGLRALCHGSRGSPRRLMSPIRNRTIVRQARLRTSRPNRTLVLATAAGRGRIVRFRRHLRNVLDPENLRQSQPGAIDAALDRADGAIADLGRLFIRNSEAPTRIRASRWSGDNFSSA